MPIDPSSADAPTSLGARLRLLRDARGWSQSQLARRAQLNRNVINTAERDRSRPVRDNLVRIAQALEVSVSVLTGEEAMSDGQPDRVGITDGPAPVGYTYLQVSCLVRSQTALSVLKLIVEDGQTQP
jgi:transcriptional regulator with XRE-family HTH domain